MSNLSSDTLFHYTSSLDSLMSILKEGINYGLFAEKLPSGNRAYFVRGISFCNIPLSMVSEHVDWYGKYAVGIKRNALRDIGASPVIYIHSLSKGFSWKNTSSEKLVSNPFLPYVKQYYGKQFHRGDQEFRYKKFYDEKEWRLYSGTPVIGGYSNVSDLEVIRKKKDREIKRQSPLLLTPEMIEYIILEDSRDFGKFDTFLRSSFKKKRDEYLTKVLFYSQFIKDL